MIVLETVVREEQGKEWIRKTFPAESNYPMVCRNPNCYTPLGILHTDIISEAAYFENGVSRREKPDFVKCPRCGTEHDLMRYLKVGNSFGGTDEVPSEARVTLEAVPALLKLGITKFPEKK